MDGSGSMRGRAILLLVLAAAAVVACSRRSSIYIEPGKAETDEPSLAHAAGNSTPAYPGR